jgi:hypothetical protein
MSKFKQEVLDKIKADADLFAKVANTMGIQPVSLPSAIERNTKTLNDYDVYKVVSEHLDMEIEDMLEEESEVKEATK